MCNSQNHIEISKLALQTLIENWLMNCRLADARIANKIHLKQNLVLIIHYSYLNVTVILASTGTHLLMRVSRCTIVFKTLNVSQDIRK